MPCLDFVRGFSRWKQLCLFEYLMPSETSGRAPVPYEKTDRYPTRQSATPPPVVCRWCVVAQPAGTSRRAT